MADEDTDLLIQHLPDEDGGKRLGPCVLLEPLGSGAMGAVYRARHTTLGIDVAVKCVHPELVRQNPEFVDRFRREVHLVARISSPHLIRIFHADCEHGLHYLIMDLIDGETAQQLVRTRGALPLSLALGIARDTARGLAHLHQQKIVHRDVKPGNILIDREGRAKLADLGLARSVGGDEELSLRRHCFGSPRFMPPEQWEDGRKVTPAADVFALGATLYFLLVGRAGLQAGIGISIYEALIQNGHPPIASALPELPPNIARLIDRCCHRDPRARFEDGAGLVRALDDCEGSEHARSPADAGGPNSCQAARAEVPPDGSTLPLPVARSPGSPPTAAGAGRTAAKRVLAIGGLSLLLGAAWALFRLDLYEAGAQAETTSAVPAVANPAAARELSSRPSESASATAQPPVVEFGRLLRQATLYAIRSRGPAREGFEYLLDLGRHTGPGVTSLDALWSDSLRIDGRVDDPGATVLCNRQPAEVSGGRFQLELFPDPNRVETDGSLPLELVAVGPGGLRADPESLTLPVRVVRGVERVDDGSGARYVLARVPAIEMVLVPATKPGPFFQSRFEITNDAYRMFCQARRHQPPDRAPFAGLSPYFEGAAFGLYPVVNVSWNDAVAFCQWAGGRLPTREQWVRAARGPMGQPNALTLQGGEGPSGNSSGHPTRAARTAAHEQPGAVELRDGYRYTAPAWDRDYAPGPYGLYHLAGNVREWSRECLPGGLRLVLGGSYDDPLSDLSADTRLQLPENTQRGWLGFRLVVELPGL